MVISSPFYIKLWHECPSLGLQMHLGLIGNSTVEPASDGRWRQAAGILQSKSETQSGMLPNSNTEPATHEAWLHLPELP